MGLLKERAFRCAVYCSACCCACRSVSHSAGNTERVRLTGESAQGAKRCLVTIRRRPRWARHIFRRPGRWARGATFLVVPGDIRPDRTGTHHRFILRRTRHRARLGAHRRNGAGVLKAAAIIPVVATIVNAISVVRSCHPLGCVVSAVAAAHAMRGMFVAVSIRTCVVMNLMLETCMRIATTGPTAMRHGRAFGKGERTQHSEDCAQHPMRRFRQPCVHHVSPARGPA